MSLRPWAVFFSLFLVIAFFPGILVFFVGMILLLIIFMLLARRVFFTRVYLNDKRWSQSRSDDFNSPFGAEQEEPIKAEDYNWEEEGDIVDLPPSALRSSNEKNDNEGIRGSRD